MRAILSIEGRQPEDVDGPRKRDLQLGKLECADGWRARGRRIAGHGREETAHDRGKMTRVGHGLDRRGSALYEKTREPEGEVDLRIADARPVPVDELRAVLGDADVVA